MSVNEQMCVYVWVYYAKIYYESLYISIIENEMVMKIYFRRHGIFILAAT